MGRKPRQKTPTKGAPDGQSRAGLFVGLGASAGGLEPLEVQHMEPHRPSLLIDRLGRHASVPVAEAADGVRPEADHAYVIAPGTLLTLEDGAVKVIPTAEPSAQAPTENFLRSLAAEKSERAVARVVRADRALATAQLGAQTGYAAPEEVAKAREAGFDAHLARPISDEALESVLGEAMLPERDEDRGAP